MRTAFDVSQNWGSGLVGSLTIENNGLNTLEKWIISLETTFDIDTIWGAQILNRVGYRYTIEAAPWNASLAPGEKTKFGFVGRNATADVHQVQLISDPDTSYVSAPLSLPVNTGVLQNNFEVSQDWGHGLVGFIHLENKGTQVLDDWVFTFETTFEIVNLWGGEIIGRDDNRYTVRAKGWNSRLDPGEKTKFGFVGRHSTADVHQVTVVSEPQFSVPTTEATVTAGEQNLSGIESLEFAIAKDWWNGFTANLSFTYSGAQPLEAWKLKFESQFEIVDLWHGEIVSHYVENGIHIYTISNASWNGTLLAGDSLTIGFNGKGSSAHNPVNYVFNDLAVEEASGESVLLDLSTKPTLSVPPEIASDPQPEIEESLEQPPPTETEQPATDQLPVQETPIADPPNEEAVVVEEIIGDSTAPSFPTGESEVEQPIAEEPLTLDPPFEEILETLVAEPPVPVEQQPVEGVSAESYASESYGESSPKYGEALQKSLLFYEAQRSGDLPEDNRIAWRGDSALKDGQDVGIDLTGGYYDAGDHVKFGFPMAGSTTLLSWGALEYYDAYVQSGQLDEILATIRWATDYFLKAHISDGHTTRAFYGQVGDPNLDHHYWGPPEELSLPRPAYKIDPHNPGSDLAAETAAALASASILFRGTDPKYADELLTNAKQLYAFADAYRGRYSDSISQAQEFYNSWSGYVDELAWGAAWLYKATGELQYLQKAEENYQNLGIDWTHNWDDKSYGTGVLLAQITDDTLYRTEVENWLDNWVSGDIARTDGGLAWLDRWGSLRYSANTALLAGIYSDTVNSAEGQYDLFSRSQIDYILGDNPAQQSYVGGIGDSFPTYIHHRSASGTSNINDPTPNRYVLHGALVGGPTSANDFSYADERTDFFGNEVALDFNAGFTGAVARLYGQEGGALLSDAALIALSETGLLVA